MSAESTIPRQYVSWDEHRNTSHVFPVSFDALPQALSALAAFKRNDPALYAWVASGAPNLTEAEHVEMFGEPYKSRRRRTAA